MFIMKNSPARSLLFLAIFFALNSANATLVQSALSPDKIGISVYQLMATTTGNVALPTTNQLPSGINSQLTKGINLGTNTDLFTTADNKYWLRYSIDSSSVRSTHNPYEYDYEYGGYPELSRESITGYLWLGIGAVSWPPNTDVFMDFGKLSTPLFQVQSTSLYFAGMNVQSPIARSLTANIHGDPDYYTSGNSTFNSPIIVCVECDEKVQLNLSFLELRWDGGGYSLFTTNQGFDQVFTYSRSYNGVPYEKIALNISPVPVPAAAWLMGSGLVGLICLHRRKK
jgi:hypothetical protein